MIYLNRSHRRTIDGETKNIGKDIIDDRNFKMPITELSHKERVVLAMLSPTEYENEQLVLIELTSNGNIIKFVQNSDSNDTIVTDFEVYGGHRQNIIDIHTHPEGTPFSPNDMWLYLKSKRIIRGSVETPKGDIFIVTKTDHTPPAHTITEEEFKVAWRASLDKADEIMMDLPVSKYPALSYGDSNKAHFIIADRFLARHYNLEWNETSKDIILDANK